MAEAAEIEVEQGLGRTVKDLVSGAAGGIAQVLIGGRFILKIFASAAFDLFPMFE